MAVLQDDNASKLQWFVIWAWLVFNVQCASNPSSQMSRCSTRDSRQIPNTEAKSGRDGPSQMAGRIQRIAGTSGTGRVECKQIHISVIPSDFSGNHGWSAGMQSEFWDTAKQKGELMFKELCELRHIAKHPVQVTDDFSSPQSMELHTMKCLDWSQCQSASNAFQKRHYCMTLKFLPYNSCRQGSGPLLGMYTSPISLWLKAANRWLCWNMPAKSWQGDRAWPDGMCLL